MFPGSRRGTAAKGLDELDEGSRPVGRGRAISATKAGATGVRVLRADSAFYNHEVIAAAGRHDTRFSITARHDE
jgi:hypothetical protein